MVTITTGKAKIIETPQKQKEKKPRVLTQQEMIDRLAALSTTEATADKIGAAGARELAQIGRLPIDEEGVIQGRLKPEFQEMEDVAARLKKASQVFPVEQIGAEGLTLQEQEERLLKPEITPTLTPREELAAEIEERTNPSFNEILTAINGIFKIFPGFRAIKTLFSGLQADKLHKELLDQADNIVRNIPLEIIDPLQAEFLFNQIEKKLIREGEQIKLESQYDVAALFAGKTTVLEEKQISSLQELQIRRGQAAEAIRTRQIAEIQAQTRRQLPAESGRGRGAQRT